MCENDGYIRLILKGLAVVVIGLFAIYNPDVLAFLFTYPVLAPLKPYHILWFLAMLVLVKRMIPKLNKKMSLGKIFARNFVETGKDTEKKKIGFSEGQKKGRQRGAAVCTILDFFTSCHVDVACRRNAPRYMALCNRSLFYLYGSVLYFRLLSFPMAYAEQVLFHVQDK